MCTTCQVATGERRSTVIHSKLELIWCRRADDDDNDNINDDGDMCIMMKCLSVCDVLSSLSKVTPILNA